MSNSNEDQNTTSKNSTKEKGHNLIKSIMGDANLVNINHPQNFGNQSQNQQNININTTPNQSTLKNNNITVMQEMKTKISYNDYNSIKELLKNSSTISQQAKNQLLNLSFSKYNLTNNRNQRKIIIELINHGADANYKLKLFDPNDKNKANNNMQSIMKSNVKINPLIYCCLKGDYELFESIKNKVNLSSANDESNNTNSHNHNNSNYMNANNNNKNYMFYFFENTSNMDNKYKISLKLQKIIKI